MVIIIMEDTYTTTTTTTTTQDITTSLLLSLTYITQDYEALERNNGGVLDIEPELLKRFKTYVDNPSTVEADAFKRASLTWEDFQTRFNDGAYLNKLIISTMQRHDEINNGIRRALLDHDNETMWNLEQNKTIVYNSLRHWLYKQTNKVLSKE